MTVAVSGDSITYPDNSVQATAPKVGMVNRIINGAMVIDQRNAGASVTPSAIGYTIDRWRASFDQASKFSVQQTPSATETGYAVRVAAGFSSYMAITSTSSYTVVSNEQFTIGQRIEGLNVSDLAWGTTNASTVTLSFLVRSSLTGTFSGALQNSAQNRAYPFAYTISAANTWEQKSITIVGETTGTWVTTNGVGINLSFCIGGSGTALGTANSWQSANYKGATGTTSVVGTSGATFYITGVQLEKGSNATSFEFIDYGRQLIQCQRYYFVATANKSNSSYPALGSGNLQSSNNARIYVKYPVDMRAAPTAAISGSITISANADYTSTAFTVAYNGVSSSMLGFAVTGAITGNGATAYVNGTNNYVDFTAEL